MWPFSKKDKGGQSQLDTNSKEAMRKAKAAETAGSESKTPVTKSQIEYLLIFANRNPDDPGVEWGPKTELLVRKVLDLIDVDSIDGPNVRIIFNPDFRPDYSVAQLGMRMLMQQPFLKLPIALSKVKFYPYRFEEASGVAAVQFK